MGTRSSKVLAPVSIAICLMTTQCGGKTKSQLVNLTVAPTQPILFTAPLTYTQPSGTQVTLQAPWFRFQLLVDVPSTMGESVTIVHVNVITSGADQNGNLTTGTADFDPVTDNYTTALGGTTCEYTDFGQFDPGGSPSNVASGSNTNDVPLFEYPSSGTSGGCIVISTVFYVGGVGGGSPPVNTNPLGQNNYSYLVQITPEGWFGTRSAPSDRFVNAVYTTTQ